MTYEERAKTLFLNGYNCAQASFAAFADILGLEEKQALRIASSFGGGMGRMREVCGALSGVFLAAGYLYGYDEPDDQKKMEHYARVQELAGQFREQFGSIICRELLDNPSTSPVPTPRTEAFYHCRPCAKYVAAAAALLEAYMLENPPVSP